MKTKGKILLVSLCAALLVSAGAVGSLAFFTDTDNVTNNFTVGNIEMTLDEKNVDDDVDSETGSVPDRDQQNDYHLIPGKSYEKDPTVHILANSEDCYVFVTVDNQIAEIECQDDDCRTIAQQMEDNGWVALEGHDGVYVYNKVVTKSDKQTDLVVFRNFEIAEDVDGTELSGYEGKAVVVDAYAVQKEGFADAKAAWEATFCDGHDDTSSDSSDIA